MESMTLVILLFNNRPRLNVETSGYRHYVLWGVRMIKTVHETEIQELVTRPRLHKMNI
jgi:stage III sporulation protein SpoIIIAA